MKKSVYLLIFITIIAGFLLMTSNALGYGVSDISGFTSQTRQGAGLGDLEYADIAAGVINIMLSIVGALFVILIISSGFTWMVSQGNQEKVDKARKTLSYAVVGLIIVIASYSIASVIITAIEEAPQGPLAGGPGGYGGDDDGDGSTGCSGSGLQCEDAYENTPTSSCESEEGKQRIVLGQMDCVSNCLEEYDTQPSCGGLTKNECNAAGGGCKWYDAGLLDHGVCAFECNRQFCCQTITNACTGKGYSDCKPPYCEWVPSATGVGGECLTEDFGGEAI
jgi:hypothetical protein